VHIERGATGTYTDAYAAAVIIGVAIGIIAKCQARCLVGDHLLIHDKTTSGKNYTTVGPEAHFLLVNASDDTHNFRAPFDGGQGACIGNNLHALFFGAAQQVFH
jgi:hypothetical protein